VWTALFLLMGYSLFLVWERHSDILQNPRMLRWWKWAMFIFFVQLTLNIVWSVLFFGLKNPGAALVEIFILWMVILFNILIFRKISRLAAWLLVPYFLWVSFAVYLNFSIWRLN
jgi:tryptophan-rich sensory protein